MSIGANIRISVDANRVLRQIERIRQMLIRPWWHRLLIGHPDVCLYANAVPRLSARYLIKKGARRGHLVVLFGWLGVTIRW